MTAGLICLGLLVLLASALYLALTLGKSRQQTETEDENTKNVLEANMVRDRLDSDPAYAERVRDRFTR